MKKTREQLNDRLVFQTSGTQKQVCPGGIPEGGVHSGCFPVSAKTSEDNKTVLKHNLHDQPMIYFSLLF